MRDQVTVVIVDKSADARECLRDMLEAEGYATMSAPHGPEARTLLRQSPTPNIVLLGTIGNATNGLSQLAIVEQEKFLLDIALDVLNESRDELIAPEGGTSAPAKESVIERHAFQLAMCDRSKKRALAPIGRLVKTSVKPEVFDTPPLASA